VALQRAARVTAGAGEAVIWFDVVADVVSSFRVENTTGLPIRAVVRTGTTVLLAEDAVGLQTLVTKPLNNKQQFNWATVTSLHVGLAVGSS
jgi:hypothetical protein